ncbi:hypothetical protein LSAC_00320, partial [Levilinea saccharolytica]
MTPGRWMLGLALLGLLLAGCAAGPEAPTPMPAAAPAAVRPTLA